MSIYFTEEIEIDGVIFHVRGLTVKELTELSMDKKSRTRTSFNYSYFYKVALRTVVGWTDMYRLDENGNPDFSHPIPFEPHLVAELPDHILLSLGNYVYSHLSSVSEEEERKLRGYMRFAYYLADKPDAVRESFSCDSCIKAKKFTSRKCGLTDEEREMFSNIGQAEEDDEPDDEIEEEAQAEETVVKPRKQLKSLRRAAVKKIAPGDDTDRPTSGYKIGGFTFSECPVSWIDDHLRTIGEQLFFCHQNKISYFSGGVSDQSYKVYSMVKIVGGEASTIDSEKQKESTGGSSGHGKNKRRDR